MKAHNKSLAEAEQMAGIIEPQEYAIFQNRGYQGLYGGLGAKNIHSRKSLKKGQQILDYMGSTELAAEEEKITLMREAAELKRFGLEFNTQENTSDITGSIIDKINLIDTFGISDYDALAIART